MADLHDPLLASGRRHARGRSVGELDPRARRGLPRSGTTQGRRYLDSTASLWYVNVGYGRAEIADAAAAQLRKLHAYSCYGDVASRPRSISRTESPRSPRWTMQWSSSRAAAARRSRRSQARAPLLEPRDQPERTVIISREAPTTALPPTARHRRHGGVQGRRRTPRLRHRQGRVGFAEALEATIDELAPDRVAAFFCEPIIGAGGVLLPPDGYLAGAARDLPRRASVLFVADEVICGYGRVGDWFACSRARPRARRRRVREGHHVGLRSARRRHRRHHDPGALLDSAAAGVWRHGYTYSGHASAAPRRTPTSTSSSARA